MRVARPGSGRLGLPWLRLALLALSWLALAPAGAQPAAGARAAELRFSVAPYLSPARMEELYTPLASALSEAMGRPVQFRTTSTFERYFEQLGNGGFDITLLHAFFYVVAVDQHRYVPIARMSEPFKGLLVVPDSSPVRSLKDLRGQLIATPPEYLPTVHLVRRAMREAGFDPARDFGAKSFRSVESCLQQIVIGEAAACICPPFALPGAEERFKVKFRTIVESPAIPNLSFVAHPRVSEEDRRRLREAVLAWSGQPEGQRLIRNIGTRAFVEVRDAEFDSVRRLMKSLETPWVPSTP